MAVDTENLDGHVAGDGGVGATDRFLEAGGDLEEVVAAFGEEAHLVQGLSCICRLHLDALPAYQ